MIEELEKLLVIVVQPFKNSHQEAELATRYFSVFWEPLMVIRETWGFFSPLLSVCVCGQIAEGGKSSLFPYKLIIEIFSPFNKLIHLHSTFATRQFLQIKLNIRSVLFLMIFLANIYNVP